jgi:hypothetical protein
MRTRPLAAAAAVGATLLLSACGGSPLDGKTGPEVAEAAAAALEEAGSVHAAGTVNQDGEEGELDIHLQGDDAIGTFTLGGREVELISVDGQAYMQGAPEFWTSFGLPEQVAAGLAGQWVVLPAEAGAGFSEFSLQGFVDELRSPGEGQIESEVSAGEVDGEDVVVVEQSDGSTLKVADDDPSYPLEIVNADEGGTIRFSRFGETEDITAPADPVDFAQLIGG